MKRTARSISTTSSGLSSSSSALSSSVSLSSGVTPGKNLFDDWAVAYTEDELKFTEVAGFDYNAFKALKESVVTFDYLLNRVLKETGPNPDRWLSHPTKSQNYEGNVLDVVDRQGLDPYGMQEMLHDFHHSVLSRRDESAHAMIPSALNVSYANFFGQKAKGSLAEQYFLPNKAKKQPDAVVKYYYQTRIHEATMFFSPYYTAVGAKTTEDASKNAQAADLRLRQRSIETRVMILRNLDYCLSFLKSHFGIDETTYGLEQAEYEDYAGASQCSQLVSPFYCAMQKSMRDPREFDSYLETRSLNQFIVDVKQLMESVLELELASNRRVLARDCFGLLRKHAWNPASVEFAGTILHDFYTGKMTNRVLQDALASNEAIGQEILSLMRMLYEHNKTSESNPFAYNDRCKQSGQVHLSLLIAYVIQVLDRELMTPRERAQAGDMEMQEWSSNRLERVRLLCESLFHATEQAMQTHYLAVLDEYYGVQLNFYFSELSEAAGQEARAQTMLIAPPRLYRLYYALQLELKDAERPAENLEKLMADFPALDTLYESFGIQDDEAAQKTFIETIVLASKRFQKYPIEERTTLVDFLQIRQERRLLEATETFAVDGTEVSILLSCLLTEALLFKEAEREEAKIARFRVAVHTAWWMILETVYDLKDWQPQLIDGEQYAFFFLLHESWETEAGKAAQLLFDVFETLLDQNPALTDAEVLQNAAHAHVVENILAIHGLIDNMVKIHQADPKKGLRKYYAKYLGKYEQIAAVKKAAKDCADKLPERFVVESDEQGYEQMFSDYVFKAPATVQAIIDFASGNLELPEIVQRRKQRQRTVEANLYAAVDPFAAARSARAVGRAEHLFERPKDATRLLRRVMQLEVSDASGPISSDQALSQALIYIAEAERLLSAEPESKAYRDFKEIMTAFITTEVQVSPARHSTMTWLRSFFRKESAEEKNRAAMEMEGRRFNRAIYMLLSDPVLAADLMGQIRAKMPEAVDTMLMNTAKEVEADDEKMLAKIRLVEMNAAMLIKHPIVDIERIRKTGEMSLEASMDRERQATQQKGRVESARELLAQRQKAEEEGESGEDTE